MIVEIIAPLCCAEFAHHSSRATTRGQWDCNAKSSAPLGRVAMINANLFRLAKYFRTAGDAGPMARLRYGVS